MNCWRALPELLAHEDIVLVTVAQTRGSVPREAGVNMLVGMTRTVDTIGGGHLEWEAMAHARAMLLQPSGPSLLKLSLGASLGQCCGGVVWLVFERIARSAQATWTARSTSMEQGIVWRRELAGEIAPEQRDNMLSAGSLWQSCHLHYQEPAAETALALNDSCWAFVQYIRPTPFNVVIFGAGHVGAAIVQILALLDVNIRWIDVRDDLFGTPPRNVTCIATDAPEDEVDKAPPDSFFLVLTHSHALDLELTARILRREAFAWFGLIGSRTKRARFEHRLQARGISATQLARLTCPIGVAGIRDKAPQAIAIAVVAQLLQAKERYASGEEREPMHDDAYDER